MKNSSVFIATAAMVIGLSACQSENPPETSTQSSPILAQSSGARIAQPAPFIPLRDLSTTAPDIERTNLARLPAPVIAQLAPLLSAPPAAALAYDANGLPYDPNYQALLQAAHQLNTTCQCLDAITQVIRQAGHARGTEPFVQRAYLHPMSDPQLLDQHADLTALVGATHERVAELEAHAMTQDIDFLEFLDSLSTLFDAPGSLPPELIDLELRYLAYYISTTPETRDDTRALTREWLSPP